MEETIFISYGRPKDYFSSEVCILAHNVPRLLWWSYGLIFFSNIVAVRMTMGVFTFGNNSMDHIGHIFHQLYISELMHQSVIFVIIENMEKSCSLLLENTSKIQYNFRVTYFYFPVEPKNNHRTIVVLHWSKNIVHSF